MVRIKKQLISSTIPATKLQIKEWENKAGVPLGIYNDPSYKAGTWLAEGVIKVTSSVGTFIYNIFSDEGRKTLQNNLEGIGKKKYLSDKQINSFIETGTFSEEN